MEPAQGERDQWSYDDGYRNGFGDAAQYKEETRAYKEMYFKLCEEVASMRAFAATPPVILQSNAEPLHITDHHDVRYLRKWLNEEQLAPIDKVALANVLTMLTHPKERVPLTYEGKLILFECLSRTRYLEARDYFLAGIDCAERAHNIKKGQ